MPSLPLAEDVCGVPTRWSRRSVASTLIGPWSAEGRPSKQRAVRRLCAIGFLRTTAGWTTQRGRGPGVPSACLQWRL